MYTTELNDLEKWKEQILQEMNSEAADKVPDRRASGGGVGDRGRRREDHDGEVLELEDGEC